MRFKLIKNAQHNAQALLNVSHLFDFLGTDNGGMHMLIEGQDHNAKALQLEWFLEAKNGSGPNIPAAASVILAKKILNHELQQIGATPCVGLITLNEYTQALNDLSIEQFLKVHICKN